MHFILAVILALSVLARAAPIAGPKSITAADYISSLHHYATASAHDSLHTTHRSHDSHHPTRTGAEDSHVGAPGWGKIGNKKLVLHPINPLPPHATSAEDSHVGAPDRHDDDHHDDNDINAELAHVSLVDIKRRHWPTTTTTTTTATTTSTVVSVSRPSTSRPTSKPTHHPTTTTSKSSSSSSSVSTRTHRPITTTLNPFHLPPHPSSSSSTKGSGMSGVITISVVGPPSPTQPEAWATVSKTSTSTLVLPLRVTQVYGGSEDAGNEPVFTGIGGL